jgi:tryptophan synthase alpha chain
VIHHQGEDRMRELIAKTKAGQFRSKPGLIPFLMAGDGGIEVSLAAMLGVRDAGAVAIELGMPHSDPIADGPLLQASTRRALSAGFRFADYCELIRKFRTHEPHLPIVAFGYTNGLYEARGAKGLEQLTAAGADAIALCDMPPEDGVEYQRACEHAGLRTVYFVGPNSPDNRLWLADQTATAFVYAVARRGTTGRATSFDDSLVSYLQRVRRNGSSPLAVGFGISTAEQVKELARHADYAVVGSALVEHLASVSASHRVSESCTEQSSAVRDAARHFMEGLTAQETKV